VHRTCANRVVELISALYNRAIDWGYRGFNPARGIKPFREVKRSRFLNQNDPDELKRIFDALAKDTSTDFKHFVYLALLTGARRENVLGMRWQDVNLDAAVWTIPDEVSKNSEAMVLALVPEAVGFLRERNPTPSG
jgi:integrase